MNRRTRSSRPPAAAFAAACWCAVAVLLGGCASPRTGLYDWGSYEDSLYDRYSRQDFATAETQVYRMLPEAGTTGRVPPGVYADYGYLLYRRGDHGGAVAYFEKEKQTYPEASLLMDKLIERVRQKDGTKNGTDTPAAGPETRLEPPPPGSPAPDGAPVIAPAPGAPGAAGAAP